MDANNPENEILKQQIATLEERVDFLERFVGRKAYITPDLNRTPASTAHMPTVESKLPTHSATANTAPKTSTEIEVGQKWLSVVGIVLVFLAVLFLFQYIFQFITPTGKVGLSYAGAATLFAIAAGTKKKYDRFSAVLNGGAWGVTYLTTYAMHFFPATQIIDSTFLEMIFLAIVVGVLLVIASTQKSKHLITVALVLGFLTMVLSPLALFSIIGTVLLLGVLVAIAITFPWGDLILAAAMGSYLSYVCWFANILGRASEDLLLEKQIVGLIALVAMWVIIATGITLRQDAEESLEGHTDAFTLSLTSGATAILGFLTINDLKLIAVSERLVHAYWALILAILHGGWAIIIKQIRLKKDVPITASVVAVLLAMASLAYFLPEQSHAIAFTWALFGLCIVGINIVLPQKYIIGTIAAIPLIGSVIRFLAFDLYQPHPPYAVTDIITELLIYGVGIAAIIICSAVLLYMRDIINHSAKHTHQAPGVILAAGFIILFATTSNELTDAIPSIFWSIAGLIAIIAGFLMRWKDARVIGLIALALTVVRVFVHDLSNLDPLPRIVSFAILGGLLLLIAYGYNRNRTKLEKLLLEE